MATRKNGNGAPVVWFEVLGRNGGQLREFYRKLFGWRFQIDAKMNYGMAEKAGTGIPGGVGQAPQGPGWTTFYVEVKDLKRTIKQTEKLGGQVLMPITVLPDVTLAVVADPEGHPVGLIAG
jgi:predicted enzyme related to lactoylglutathione lyase